MSIVSVLVLSIKPKNATTDCKINVGIACGLVMTMWILIFAMLFLQVIGCVKCLKQFRYGLIAFYAYIVSTVYVSQMMLWSSGGNGSANQCRTGKPAQWWWLLINVCFFYVMVVFGLATWGSYLCGIQDKREVVIQTAIDEYLKSGIYKRKQVMLMAGGEPAVG